MSALVWILGIKLFTLLVPSPRGNALSLGESGTVAHPLTRAASVSLAQRRRQCSTKGGWGRRRPGTSDADSGRRRYPPPPFVQPRPTTAKPTVRARSQASKCRVSCSTHEKAVLDGGDRRKVRSNHIETNRGAWRSQAECCSERTQLPASTPAPTPSRYFHSHPGHLHTHADSNTHSYVHIPCTLHGHRPAPPSH